VLISSHLLRLLFLDEPEMKILFSCLIRLAIAVLVQLHLFVQFFSVYLGDVLHHHRDVLRVKLSLNDRGSTSNF
jgi:hypothetical protein